MISYDGFKDLIRSKGLTLEVISEKTGMTRAGLMRAFSNNSIKVETLQKIADILNIPICQFFSSEDSILQDPLNKLKTYINDLKISLEYFSYLDTILLDNKDFLLDEILIFAETILDEKETKLLLKSCKDYMEGEFDYLIFISEKSNEKDSALISKYLLWRPESLSLIKNTEKRKALKRLQTVFCDKYLDVIQKDELLTFIRKENLIDPEVFFIHLNDFVKKFLNPKDSVEMLKRKGIFPQKL